MTFPLTEQGRYGRATGTRAMSDSERIEKCVQAYRNINRFLASFIDHVRQSLLLRIEMKTSYIYYIWTNKVFLIVKDIRKTNTSLKLVILEDFFSLY